MDYEGQKLAELLFYYIILLFGGVGWIIGHIQQDFTIVFQAWLVGVIISTILCVPDWPFYNRHPIQWLESVPDRRQELQDRFIKLTAKADAFLEKSNNNSNKNNNKKKN